MKLLKKALSLVCILAAISGFLISGAFADESNVTYTGNSGDIVFVPKNGNGQANLFPDFSGVMPGDSLTQKISVKNNADNKVKVKIYLRSLGADKGSEEFLRKLRLTVTPEGQTPVFEASADKTDGLTDWTELGILYSGGETELTVTLDVPIELDNRYQKQTGKIKWQFLVIEMPVDEDMWVCPVCHSSHYRIIDYKDHSEYMCEKCGHTEDMRCKECGGRMHLVIKKDMVDRVWYYYECNDNSKHHTDPVPQTGDESHPILWISLLAVSIGLIILTFVIKPKKEKDEGVVMKN